MNEVNTIPGSLSHYLWIDPRLSFTSLLLDLLTEAIARPRPRTRRPARTDRSCELQGPSPASSDERQFGTRAARDELPDEVVGPWRGDLPRLEKLNWSYLFWPSVLTVVVLAGCVAVFVLWSSAPTFMAWVLLAFGVCVFVYFAARYIGWRTKSFVVTSQRIVYRTGALRRTGREIPIGRVQDVTYHQTVVERIVRAGSLTVESAGRHGQDPFPDITRPAEVQSLINRVVAQATGGFAVAQVCGVTAPATAAPPVGTPPVAESPPITDPTPRDPSRHHRSSKRCHVPRRRRPSASSLASWRSFTSTGS